MADIVTKLVIVIVILLIIILYPIGMSIAAIVFKSKRLEKLGLLGPLGHDIHQMVDGKSYVDIRYNHYNKLKQKQDQEQNAPLITGGYDDTLYDPDF